MHARHKTRLIRSVPLLLLVVCTLVLFSLQSSTNVLDGSSNGVQENEELLEEQQPLEEKRIARLKWIEDHKSVLEPGKRRNA